MFTLTPLLRACAVADCIVTSAIVMLATGIVGVVVYGVGKLIIMGFGWRG